MNKYCKKCMYPNNHALGILIDKNGVCSGCRVHEEKNQIDWGSRKLQLQKYVKTFIKKSDYYNCVIPINGNGDSFFLVDYVVRQLGLRPLCVNYNSHFTTDTGCRNLFKIRNNFGVKLIQKTLAPSKIKDIVRYTMSEYGNIYWHAIAGQTVFPVQVAVDFKIPLIIWGCHQGIDQVGMFSHFDYVEMTRKYREEHDLFGIEPESLANDDSGICKTVLKSLFYPIDRDICKIGVKGIYLNNYLRWDSWGQYRLYIKKYSMEGRKHTRTFDSFSNPHCLFHSDIHDYFKYIKLGYSRINDHVARDIRLGYLDKANGQELIKVYANRLPDKLKYFLNWIGLDTNGFEFLIKKFRNYGSTKILDSEVNNHYEEPHIEYVRQSSMDNGNNINLLGHGL